ncbi:uncharacterized protein LOC127574388 isoform X2 [Pristis pectinata]|uniref:uncharacterized protein LOC127574388 isoform X2 n=1 Tax=Pristis pectinata TaxID=685728 RepID=UPI00223CECAA|nr:uncharacterized protein LOC127574388 isoform X2 [Pristis pectinata]
MANINLRRICLLVSTLVVYIITLIMNALAGKGPKSGIFLQTVGNISNKLSTEFTPAGWTFSIWGVIYTWQAVWLIYVCSGLCRRHTIPALIFLALVAFTNYVVLFFSYHGLYTQGPWLQKYRKVDLWLVRILVQNGIAVYATWTTIATLLNFAVVLTYNASVTMVTSGTICLSLLAFEVVLWFYLENFVFDKYVRYTLTIYPVVIVALSGSLDKHYEAISPTRNNIYIAVLLATACIAFAARIAIVTWRHFKHPLHQSTEE